MTCFEVLMLWILANLGLGGVVGGSVPPDLSETVFCTCRIDAEDGSAGASGQRAGATRTKPTDRIYNGF